MSRQRARRSGPKSSENDSASEKPSDSEAQQEASTGGLLSPPMLAGFGALLIALTVVFWIVIRPGGGSGDDNQVPTPPMVERDGLSRPVNQLLDSAYESIDRGPNEGSSWGLLGQALYANGFQDEGVECFIVAQRLDKKDGRWPYYLGRHIEADDPKKAEEHFLSAIDKAEYSDVIRMHYAEFLFDQNRNSECLELLEDLRQSMGDYERLDLLEARIAMREQDLQRAKRLAEKAVEQDPQRPEIHAVLQQIYFGLQMDDEARASQALAEVESEISGWPDYYWDNMMAFRRDIRYRIYVAENSNVDPAEFVALLREAVDLEPQIPGWHGRLANLYLQIGELDEARTAIEKGLSLHAESAELHYIRGLIEFFSEDYVTALEGFTSAIEYKPDYVESIVYQGLTHRELNQLPEAIEAFQSATRFEATNIQASYNLAITLRELGNISDARLEYERLLGLEPPLPDPYLEAAELFIATQEYDKARGWIQTAMAMDPTDPRARALLEQIPN